MADQPNDPAKFPALSEDMPEPSLIGEFWQFLKESKKWWLTPIVAVLLLLGGLVYLSGTAAAPLIYSLF